MIRFAIEQGRDQFTNEDKWDIIDTVTGTVIDHSYDPEEAQEICDYYNDRQSEDVYQEDDEPWYDALDADADALASAGWGTDEDYGGFDEF